MGPALCTQCARCLLLATWQVGMALMPQLCATAWSSSTSTFTTHTQTHTHTHTHMHTYTQWYREWKGSASTNTQANSARKWLQGSLAELYILQAMR